MADGTELDRDEWGVAKRYERIADLHEVAIILSEGLDELGLHEAAAYVSLARRRIRISIPFSLCSRSTIPGLADHDVVGIVQVTGMRSIN